MRRSGTLTLRRPRTLALAMAPLGALASLGCGKLLGAEDFTIVQGGDAAVPDADATDAAVSDAVAPADSGDAAVVKCPVTPDTPWLESTGSTPLYDATCMACLQDKCKDQFDACAANPDCAVFLESVKTCGDPRCWRDAVRPYGFDWEQMPSNKYKVNGLSLDWCTGLSCVDACRIGRNFDCVGKYVWSGSQGAGAMTFEVTVGAAVPVVGARVQACWSADCSVPASDSVITGADAKALVEVQMGVSTSTTGFSGYFSADPPSGADPPRVGYDLLRNHPFPFGEKLWLLLPTVQAIDTLLQDQAQSSYDPKRVYGAGYVNDCNFFGSVDAEVEVRSASPDAVALPPGAASQYLGRQYFVGPLDPECPVLLTVKEPKSGLAIAKLSHSVRAGRGFDFFLVPRGM